MGILTETLRLVVTGDSKGAQKALGDLARSADTANKSTSKWGQGLNTASNYAMGAAGAMAGVIGVSVHTLEGYGKELKSVERLTGANAEQASLIAGQMKLIGGESVNAGDAMAFYAKNLGLAQQGGGPALETFEKYGISLRDANGEFRTAADVLMEFRDKLSEQENGSQRAADAAAVMGRAYKNILPWFTKSREEIAEMNETIADTGMVWSDEDMEQWGKAMAAQKKMRFALTGVQVTLASDVIPYIEPVVKGFGDLLRTLRPIMPVLVPLTAGLAVFGGVVKGGMGLASFIRGLGAVPSKMGPVVSGLGRLIGGFRNARVAESAFSGRLGTLGGMIRTLANGGLAVGRRGFSSLAGILKNLPALLSSTGAMYGLVAAGIAVDTVLIYEAIKAWQQLSDAIDEARKATQEYADNSQAQLDRVAQQYGKNSEKYREFAEKVKAINADAAADQYKYPWWYGPGAWLANAGKPLPGWQNTGNQVPGLANEGLVKASPGGTIVRVAEGGEDEVVLKASRFKGGSSSVPAQHFHLHVGQVVGTDRAALQRLARELGPLFVRQIRYANG